MSTTWRDSCRGLIAETIRANKDMPMKDIKKALREVYPFGERKYHPYKTWCDEVKIQLGLKKKKIRGEIINPDQLELLNID